MAVFVVAHGAWTGGWFWRKLRPLLQARGHAVHTPTCSGVGERSRDARPDIDLDRHIDDLLQWLHFEDLRDVVLVAHSYGGMVATGVADRASARIAQLVYVDAFVPRDGDSVMSLLPAEQRQRLADLAAAEGEGWRLPPNPMPPDTPADDLAWAVPRRQAQPIATFTQPIVLTGAVDRLPRSYVYCTRAGPGDAFRPFAERARREAGWRCHELDASHNPQVTMPETLARLLIELAGA